MVMSNIEVKRKNFKCYHGKNGRIGKDRSIGDWSKRGKKQQAKKKQHK